MSRILHILASARAEGTPRLVLDWLALGDAEQAVLVLSGAYPDLAAELAASSAAFFIGAVDLDRGGSVRRSRTVAAITQACADFGPDVVICWPTWAAAAAGCVVKRHSADARLVIHCGNPAEQSWRERLVADLRFLPAYQAGGIFACCSDYVRDSFRRRSLVAAARFQTVPNCVQVERVAQRAATARRGRTPGGKTRFVMVGTLEGHKDQATLVRAASLLAERRRDFEVWLVGGGAMFEAVKAQVVAARMEGVVSLLGMRADVPELLGGSDAFVFSTTAREGFGTVFIEALAAGLPVIASDVPACRDALRAGTFGRLVSPQDATALAAAMNEFLGNPAAFQPDASAVAGYLRKFSPSSMKDAYLSLSA